MKRAVLFGVFGSLMLLAVGCGTCSRSVGRPFTLGKDSFAFANELQWTYEFPENGPVITRDADPAPEYPLRCFPITRSAREFFYHARFAPELSKTNAETYAQLVGQVVKRNSRCPVDQQERIVIPGYDDLFSFSVDHPSVLRRHSGGPLRSYFQRGNWRMIFPVSRWGKRRTARRLVEEIENGRVPIVHVYRFPTVTLNHAILLFGVEKNGDRLSFLAYDPNNPGRPASLAFQSDTGTFLFERNQYFGGGPVQVYEVFRGWFY